MLLLTLALPERSQAGEFWARPEEAVCAAVARLEPFRGGRALRRARDQAALPTLKVYGDLGVYRNDDVLDPDSTRRSRVGVELRWNLGQGSDGDLYLRVEKERRAWLERREELVREVALRAGQVARWRLENRHGFGGRIAADRREAELQEAKAWLIWVTGDGVRNRDILLSLGCLISPSESATESQRVGEEESRLQSP